MVVVAMGLVRHGWAIVRFRMRREYARPPSARLPVLTTRSCRVCFAMFGTQHNRRFRLPRPFLPSPSPLSISPVFVPFSVYLPSPSSSPPSPVSRRRAVGKPQNVFRNFLTVKANFSLRKSTTTSVVPAEFQYERAFADNSMPHPGPSHQLPSSRTCPRCEMNHHNRLIRNRLRNHF